MVLRYVDHVVKGFIDVGRLDSSGINLEVRPPLNSNIRITIESSQKQEELSIREAKAVFFVKTFDGDSERRDINFHTDAEVLPKLWVKVTFQDGEAIEGFIQNNSAYFGAEGFYLEPTDPTSNNVLVYVIKRYMANFQVLGLRR